MDADTAIGGPRHTFPHTRHSIVIASKSSSAEVRQQAFGALVAAYWKPVYKYIRVKWSASNEDAKDLTQEFFTATVEKSFFDSYDPGKSRFRTYMRICVDGIVMNARKSSARIKRGGRMAFLTLDFDGAEGELARMTASKDSGPDAYFEREWTRSLFALAVEDLRTDCHSAGKTTHFAIFEKCDLDPPGSGRPSYAELAEEFGIPVTQVTNYLAFARSGFRRHVLDRLRNLTGSAEEFRSEAHRILGIDVP